MYTDAENMNMINQAEHRAAMKYKLGKIGCQFDGTETDELLEEMMRINNLEA